MEQTQDVSYSACGMPYNIADPRRDMNDLVVREGAAHRINALAVALHQRMTVEAFSQCDLAYAPPFSPVWDPMLTAAQQLLKKM